MRVSIEHREKYAGLFRNIPQVEVLTAVQFSEVELEIIESRRLEDYIVLERAPDSHTMKKFGPGEYEACADLYYLRVKDLMRGKPDRFTFDTPVEAKLYEQALSDTLREMKAFLEAAASPSGAHVFEI